MKPLDILIRCLSALVLHLSAIVWRLESIRARRQCERDHRQANQLGRRNLTDDQRAMIADAVAEIESGLALKETAANARKAKDGASLAAVVQPKRTSAKTAKAAKVSERKMKKARAIRKKSPTLAALQCPACRHLVGAPASWPSPACPMCGETMLPFALGASVAPDHVQGTRRDSGRAIVEGRRQGWRLNSPL